MNPGKRPWVTAAVVVVVVVMALGVRTCQLMQVARDVMVPGGSFPGSAEKTSSAQFLEVPFLKRFQSSSQGADVTDIDNILLGRRRFAQGDRRLLEPHRAFLADFLAWYSGPHPTTANDWRVKAGAPPFSTHPSTQDLLLAPNFRNLRLAANAVVLAMEECGLTRDARGHAALWHAYTGFLHDADLMFGTYRTLISHMIFLALERVGFRHMLRHLAHGKVEADELAWIAAELKEHLRQRIDFKQTVAAERFNLLTVARNLSTEGSTPQRRAIALDIAADLDRRTSAAYGPVERILEDDSPSVQRKAALQKHMGEILPEYSGEVSMAAVALRCFFGGRTAVVTTIAQTMMAIALPNFAVAFKRDTDALAMARGALVATKVLAARTAGGRLPETLEGLSKTGLEPLPTDPWTGQPFLYRVATPDFVLYSAGEDGTDDGGIEKSDLLIYPDPK